MFSGRLQEVGNSREHGVYDERRRVRRGLGCGYGVRARFGDIYYCGLVKGYGLLLVEAVTQQSLHLGGKRIGVFLLLTFRA